MTINPVETISDLTVQTRTIVCDLADADEHVRNYRTLGWVITQVTVSDTVHDLSIRVTISATRTKDNLKHPGAI